MAIQGFYWVIHGTLAGCSLPGGGYRGDRTPQPRAASATENAAALDADLAWLREHGIRAILSLTEKPLPADALARHGLASLHLPVIDMTAPEPEQFEQALAFIDSQRGQGRAVVAHCKMGQGRTGSILAAYLIRAGASPEEALRQLRAICPGAVGSPEQVRALHAFAFRRDWIV